MRNVPRHRLDRAARAARRGQAVPRRGDPGDPGRRARPADGRDCARRTARTCWARTNLVGDDRRGHRAGQPADGERPARLSAALPPISGAATFRSMTADHLLAELLAGRSRGAGAGDLGGRERAARLRARCSPACTRTSAGPAGSGSPARPGRASPPSPSSSSRPTARAGLRVAVVAVDPTSPFTGGALLGDRIRMESVALDEGVYIRSMATRGSLGGLATTTREVCDLLDAAGFDRILVETVGVGQSELDVARMADTHRAGAGARVGRRHPDAQVRASWRSPTSSWSTRPTAPAPTSSARRSR